MTVTKFAGKLTPADVALCEQLRDDWMTTALSTERCDRPAAEAAIKSAYRAAGLAEPQLMIWMDSPLGGCFASAVLRHHVFTGGQLGGQLYGQLGGQLGDQLWGQLRDQLGDQLRDQLGGQLGGQLRGQLGGQLGDQLGGQLRDQLGDQLGGQLGDQLGGQLRDQLGDQLRDQLGGQLGDQLGGQLRDQLGDQLRDQLGGQLGGQLDPWYESYWIAWYTAALRIAPLASSPRLDSMAAAVGTTDWWWPMRGGVVMTDRPTVLNLDQLRRFHCEDGPALVYADGYTLHSWHGVRVPADLIETGWDTGRILREPNAEIRRCAIERMGWPEFVHGAGLQLVGPLAPDPGNPGQVLGLYDLPDQLFDEPVRVLVCTNATPERDGTLRRFGLTVPAEITDPVAAAAWTFDLPPDLYATTVRAS